MFVVVFQTSKMSSMKEIENKISKLFLLLSFQCNENKKSTYLIIIFILHYSIRNFVINYNVEIKWYKLLIVRPHEKEHRYHAKDQKTSKSI